CRSHCLQCRSHRLQCRSHEFTLSLSKCQCRSHEFTLSLSKYQWLLHQFPYYLQLPKQKMPEQKFGHFLLNLLLLNSRPFQS
ncbi:MAG TPA: hypothetical protein PLA77_02225, partial [Bacteroidales bacterium]|nr:hypothetical protein [Bacteroidales bacterium]